MNYPEWREEVFGQEEGADPVMVELAPEVYALSPEQNLEFVMAALSDVEIHECYSRQQIGVGLQVIFNNACGNTVFCFLEAAREADRVAGIRALANLYTNYFERYCCEPVASIGDDCADGVNYLCYMFWDIFVVHPQNSPHSVVQAALDVMQTALQSSSESCQVSALHGLGHWVAYLPEARRILETFLAKNAAHPNPILLTYAKQAATGCVQ